MSKQEVNSSENSLSITQKFLQEIISILDNSLHKRLIQKYNEQDPVTSMGNELGHILEEVISYEDR